MMKRKRNVTKTLLSLLAFFLIQTSAVYAEEYQHVLTLESPTPEKSAWFGYQVKIRGDIILLSEPYADVDDIIDAGKLYIYDVDGKLFSTLQSPEPGNVNRFGDRFDQHGDTIIVKDYTDIGVFLKAGKAHVFTTDGTHKLTLQSPEPTRGGGFGGASIHDDVTVIYESTSEGRVYLYDDEGEYLKTLHSPTPIIGGKFGRTIEVSETLILLGECGYGTTPIGPGRVYVFNHGGDHLMTLQAPEPENQALFGESISTSGDLIVVGESYATAGEVWRAGRVYIFNADGEHLKTLESPNPKMNGQFGDSVSIDGDRLVVGERFANVNPFQYEGRAYVFDIEGNLLQNLTAPDLCPRAAFGLDVDIEGDTIVIGECWADTEDIHQAGRAHVYRLGPSAGAQEPVKETTPVAEEEPETEDVSSSGVPGFPAIALALGTVLAIVFTQHAYKSRVKPKLRGGEL